MATATGELLLRERPATLKTESKSSPTDAVTAMDRAAEELISATLRDLRPGDGLLGEEGGERAGATGVRWIVDPLDGTVNYVYGLPLWSVSIAAEVDGVVVAGVVRAPALGRTYAAYAGGGAWREDLEGRGPIRSSEVSELGMSLVGTGFGYSSERRAEQATVVAALLPCVRDIRRLGSAALDLCLVADGELDAYYERGLNAWDVAAGAVIAREAGAEVRGFTGRWPDADMTLACAPGIADRMVDVLGLPAIP